MTKKLELVWPGKDDTPIRPEPRILIEAPELSNTANDPITPNMLIHGDNLMALKALERDFAGKVKCIYIDPPYNTGAAFEHYDDNFEHSTWLNLMRPRLELLRKLLREDGSIWISIDDDEGHYLKVLCDEVFGRDSFITTVVWQKRTSPDNRLRIGDAQDFILVYVKNRGNEQNFNLLPINAKRASEYKNLDNDPRGAWASVDITGQTGHATPSQFYQIITPSGKGYFPPEGRCWALSQDTFNSLVADNRIWFGKDGDSRPRQKRFISEMEGQSAWSWWPNDEVGHNQEAKKENIKLFGQENAFDTPKPERLIERILTLATNPGDLVLDSFLGSGTTAAVAHKMGRHYIGIEIGDHAYTHCKVRLDKVIAGEDQGGITKAIGWTGGGGYRFYELAPTLINTDEYGQATINKAYNDEMLAEAVALHEGFTYDPDETLFWKQSRGSEKSYLYVTRSFVSREIVEAIHGTMNDDEYLIIACKNYDSGIKVPNITIKKIPQSVLGRCEFEKNDYNLNIRQQSEETVADGLFDEEGEGDFDEDFDETPETSKVHSDSDKQMSIGFDDGSS